MRAFSLSLVSVKRTTSLSRSKSFIGECGGRWLRKAKLTENLSYVEVLDRYFGNVRASICCISRLLLTRAAPRQVCELDLYVLSSLGNRTGALTEDGMHCSIFNYQKAYAMLDELVMAGEMQESSKKSVLRAVMSFSTHATCAKC